MNKCRFCQIVETERKDEEVVFENEEFLVITDKYRRTSAGAICLLITREHVPNILELTKHNKTGLLETLDLISKAMQKAYNCNGIRIWTAVNKEAGQSVFHCHIHILACKSIRDRIVASFPGVYDLVKKILTLGNNKLNYRTNFRLAEKIRSVINAKH